MAVQLYLSDFMFHFALLDQCGSPYCMYICFYSWYLGGYMLLMEAQG